ncbi:MAG: immunity 7 family protein [Lachnospiraceae bacterium]|nr:immunity 7 family protein [Lachnospiraceae bacterium]
MIELHGWVTIRETYKVTFDEEEHIEIIVQKIRDEIDKLHWFKPIIKVMNGEWFLEFSLFSNRKDSRSREIFELYKRIGEIALGSYGLIYLYDDEDMEGKENLFQVFSLARGIVEEREDSFLSPVIPTIEDKDEL